MNKSQCPNQLQRHDLEEAIIEIKDIYERISEKISYLNEIGKTNEIQQYSQDADCIFGIINRISQNLSSNQQIESESLKHQIFEKLEKIIDLEMRIKEIYSKEFQDRLFTDNELVEILSSPSPRLFTRDLGFEFEEALEGPIRTLNDNEDESFEQLSERIKQKGKQNIIVSACNSNFSAKFVLDTAPDVQHSDDESYSLEEEKPDHDGNVNRIGSETARNENNDSAVALKYHNPFIKEISNYEFTPLSDEKQTENIILCQKPKRQASPCKSSGALENYNRVLFRDPNQMMEFLGGNYLKGTNASFLWRYIFSLQENLLMNAEAYKKRLSDLEKEIEQKDKTIHELMKEHQRVNTNKEANYYENLALVHNPKKLITKIKASRSGQENQNSNHQKTSHSNLPNDLEIRIKTSCSSISLPKRSLNNIGTFQRSHLPLVDISTNQSIGGYFDANVEENLMPQKDEEEVLFSSGDSCASLTVVACEDDVVFSNQNNMKAYLNNLQETLEVMKENNYLMQTENVQLKEYISTLQNELTTIQKSKEKIVFQQKTVQKHKEFRNFQAVADGSFKWANAKKFQELEQKNKTSLERFKNIPLLNKSLKA